MARYTVSIPLTSYWVTEVEAESPDAAIAQALEDFDPNDPEHLPESTAEMGFNLSAQGAEAEAEGIDHDPETGQITSAGEEHLRRELQAQLDAGFLQEVAQELAAHCARRSR